MLWKKASAIPHKVRDIAVQWLCLLTCAAKMSVAMSVSAAERFCQDGIELQWRISWSWIKTLKPSWGDNTTTRFMVCTRIACGDLFGSNFCQDLPLNHWCGIYRQRQCPTTDWQSSPPELTRATFEDLKFTLPMGKSTNTKACWQVSSCARCQLPSSRVLTTDLIALYRNRLRIE
jgi:hypothetical protein